MASLFCHWWIIYCDRSNRYFAFIETSKIEGATSGYLKVGRHRCRSFWRIVSAICVSGRFGYISFRRWDISYRFLCFRLLAALLGGVVGYVMGQCLERGLIPEFLKSPLLLATILLVFALSDAIMHETGLLAVTVMGLVMANMHLTSHHELLHFKENISVILISSVFIMLTSSLTIDTLWQIVDWRMLLFVLAMMFIVRPLSIWIATINTGLTLEERALIGWIAPRGIVALTVSGYFTTALQDVGFQSAQLLTALTLALVLRQWLPMALALAGLRKIRSTSFHWERYCDCRRFSIYNTACNVPAK